MKITEIIRAFLYVATVKAKRGNLLKTVKTIVFADGVSQARALLAAIYGEENVVSVNRISESQLSEAIPNRTKPVVQPVPKVLPTEYAHSLAQKALLTQMRRNALHVKPTIDDLRAAQDDFEAEQKRVNREYEDKLKWAEIRRRRTN